MKIPWRRLKPGSCQTHEHETDCLTPEFRQTHTAPDPTIASFAFLVTTVASVINYFNVFSIAQSTHSYTQECQTFVIISEVDRFMSL
jgi:hypothetical protein